MTAVTEPGPAAGAAGSGTPSRKADTVDELLEGFGPARADQPRILPNRAVTTPAPELPKSPKKESTSTEPGSRQRQRNVILALVLSFAIVLVVGLALVLLASHR